MARPLLACYTGVSMRRGELFILSAPSGTGKTTLIQRLLALGLTDPDGSKSDLVFAISHTTRQPREGEVNGEDYHFIEAEVFRGMTQQDEFLEWAQVHGNYYGTARAEVFPRLEAGRDVVLDIDVQGAEQVMRRYPPAHGIFLLPPSYRDLEERLHRRGLDDGEEIRRRLAMSLEEIRRYPSYEYVIVNDDADRASRALAALILEKRHRLEAMRHQATAILADFEAALATPA